MKELLLALTFLLVSSVNLITPVTLPEEVKAEEQTAVSTLNEKIDGLEICDIAENEVYRTKMYYWKCDTCFHAVAEKDGILTLELRSMNNETLVYVYDAQGNEVKPKEIQLDAGFTDESNVYDHTVLIWNSIAKQFEGRLIYELKEGDYYIEFERAAIYNGGGALSFTANFGDEIKTNIDNNFINYNLYGNTPVLYGNS